MLIAERLLSKNQFSRPGTLLHGVRAVAVHYVQNPGQSPEGVWRYFEDLKRQKISDHGAPRYASAHYIVGMTGQIFRVVPEGEVAYHCGGRSYTPEAKEYFGDYCTDPHKSPNLCAIGIEMCHPDTSGLPTPATASASQLLIRDICSRYGLNPAVALWRHYDITGKLCPLWYVDHPSEWARFREAVEGKK